MYTIISIQYKSLTAWLTHKKIQNMKLDNYHSVSNSFIKNNILFLFTLVQLNQKKS